MPETTSPTPSRQVRTDHPGLTIRIRRVNRHGEETESDPVINVRPAQAPMVTAAWPPCRCDRCGGGGNVLSVREARGPSLDPIPGARP